MFLQIFLASLSLSLVLCDVSHLYGRPTADYDPNPHYSYSYSVNDALTGDNHAQQETRNGDAVSGSYSLIEADGSLRTVRYTADPLHGFNAVVDHTGGYGRPAPAAVVPRPLPAVVAPVPYAPARLPIAPLAARPYAYAGHGAASVHTSFSGPHASYHY